MVNINLKISNKTFYTLITLVILLALIIGVYSYGTSDPPVFGHTPSEIDPGTFAGGGNYIFPSDSDVRASIFYDQDNTGYYVDPAGTSKFNTINLGGVSRSSWPSGGLSGYEIKTASQTSASHFTVDVYCSAGKKVLGGGCNQQAGVNRALVDNNPISTTGWHCRGRDVITSQTITLTAYAICATID